MLVDYFTGNDIGQQPLSPTTINRETGKGYVGANTQSLSAGLNSPRKGNPPIVYTNGIYKGPHIFVIIGFNGKTKVSR